MGFYIKIYKRRMKYFTLKQQIIEKYCDHLPLYRQLERMKRAGIKLAYSTVAEVQAQIGDILVPLY
jgi:transposase